MKTLELTNEQADALMALLVDICQGNVTTTLSEKEIDELLNIDCESIM